MAEGLESGWKARGFSKLGRKCAPRIAVSGSWPSTASFWGRLRGRGDWRWWSVASGLWRVWVATALVCCGLVGEAMNEREELVLTSETVAY
ncbi:hypothetical protein C1H46_013126 [Malus baccata]|uniref:Uncharacterized protein n=1 Tax=Malus baccata TaxID=106549 RepID=A0A540MQZ6_MALBA|nr:hypothetical protein C1H46_013126 [Malus baccata]